MNASRFKSAAQQAGVLAFVAVCVGGLTIAFNLFGALFSSVLVGMMTGALRRLKWQTVFISLVFPSVVLALGQVTKIEVGWRHRLTLSILCFGAFWTVHFLTWLMMCLEKRDDPPDAQPASCKAASPASAELDDNSAVEQFSLNLLQGTWLYEADSINKTERYRRINITGDKFIFTIVDAIGERSIKGDIVVDGASPFVTFSVGGDRAIPSGKVSSTEPHF